MAFKPSDEALEEWGRDALEFAKIEPRLERFFRKRSDMGWAEPFEVHLTVRVEQLEEYDTLPTPEEVAKVVSDLLVAYEPGEFAAALELQQGWVASVRLDA